MSKKQLNELSPAEAQVIRDKGTERPFSGEYVDTFEQGLYLCRQCDAPLYRSDDKFRAHCGWPAFDDEIPGAVERKRDRDGRRTEILCRSCGGHLGHVFEGEGLTEKNIRHCVNSISLVFCSAERALFAGGCFWGMEHWFRKQVGVLHTAVGYTGGSNPAPSYEEVCRGDTGHVEAVEVIFDPALIEYETLARLFFEIHDPTQVDGQGADIGSQYRSVVFSRSKEQREIAQQLIDELEAKGFAIATEVRAAEEFWPAEQYHQRYLERGGSLAPCHVYTKRF